MGSLPALIYNTEGPKIAITEADLEDYPGMYLKGSDGGNPCLYGKFPEYPLKEKQTNDRTVEVSKRAGYLAQTKGDRVYPWRVIVIAEKDADLIESDIVFRLGKPLQLKDTSWIKPGKVSWDWWNACNIYGVDFKSGINTKTYKYYVDFASENNIEYIILDEGWSDPSDLFKINPDVNMEELLRYAEKKNVGIILWCVWVTLDKQLQPALDMFEKWGIKGIKVDFMQRDDQKMVNYYHKIAIEAAKRHLLVDFHGAYKPAGLRRAYPNVLTREGVKGLEQSKWCGDVNPEHDLTIPFIRMLAGPMDYTPGAMNNAQKKYFRPVYYKPMSQGTRIHQLAMYVVYESPLQMLCDSPSNYKREPEMMKFLSRVPTVWDETKVLDAKVSDYVIVARKYKNEWYVGAMTDWTPRIFTIDFSFLEEGEYMAEMYSDGENASRYASDFKITFEKISQKDSLQIKLAPGGGWAARIYRAEE
jgi:alpha-glucosidase